MIKKLSCILLSIIILLFSSSIASAAASQTQKDDSFFSFLKNNIIMYLATADEKRHVLAAQTIVTVTPPSITPQPINKQPQLSEVSSYILNGVNEYRASLGLSPVQATDETCSFAATRAEEITKGFTHDGFYDRVHDHTIPYAEWAHATENIAQAPDYKEVVSLWEKSPDHAANMRDNTPYVCIQQSGSYYAYEGMRP